MLALKYFIIYHFQELISLNLEYCSHVGCVCFIFPSSAFPFEFPNEKADVLVTLISILLTRHHHDHDYYINIELIIKSSNASQARALERSIKLMSDTGEEQVCATKESPGLDLDRWCL